MYAHAIIEHGGTKYSRGDRLPDDLPGLAELVEWGSAGPNLPTDDVTIDTQGNIVRGRPDNRVHRFEGDWTHEQISNEEPHRAGAFLGTHRNEEEHRAQEPHLYRTDDAEVSD